MFGFVPCQAVQDRRACQIYLAGEKMTSDFNGSDHLWTFALSKTPLPDGNFAVKFEYLGLALILVVSLLLLITVVRCRTHSPRQSLVNRRGISIEYSSSQFYF